MAGRPRQDRQEACHRSARSPGAIRHQGRASGRVYDYGLGGKGNFAADPEAAAEQAIGDFPATVAGVKQQRAFLASDVVPEIVTMARASQSKR